MGVSMFQFWYEKFIALFIPFFVFLSFFAIVFYAFYTVIAVPPAENAPFVQEIRETAAQNTAANVVKLDKPHRSESEMKTLLTMMASESLSFSKENFSEVLKNINPYFTDRGFKQYKDYLLESGIVESVRVNDYDMSVYIEDSPMFLNGSVVDDIYKWLYQMPVVVSFFPKNTETAAEDTDTFVNRKFNLRLQITRAKVGDDPDALQIEDWIVVTR